MLTTDLKLKISPEHQDFLKILKLQKNNGEFLTWDAVRAAYKKCALVAHSDKGGSDEAFIALSTAYRGMEAFFNPDPQVLELDDVEVAQWRAEKNKWNAEFAKKDAEVAKKEAALFKRLAAAVGLLAVSSFVDATTKTGLTISLGLLLGALSLLIPITFSRGLFTNKNNPEPASEPVEATNQEHVCPSF
jgi:hypothetical protein